MFVFRLLITQTLTLQKDWFLQLSSGDRQIEGNNKWLRNQLIELFVKKNCFIQTYVIRKVTVQIDIILGGYENKIILMFQIA